jgi:enoyl-CoA hydratase
VKGHEVVDLGVATHFTPSSAVPELKARLSRDGLAALLPLETNRRPLTFVEGLHHFAQPSLEGLLAALEKDGSEWAVAQAALIRARSPWSLAVTLRQLAAGRSAARFEDVMELEYRLATRMVATGDFQEGVRAVIVDKNAPRWAAPPTPQELDALFAPLPEAHRWTALDPASA